MATKNDITGDSIKTRGPSKAYEDNYDRIFGKKEPMDYVDGWPNDKQFSDEKVCKKCGFKQNMHLEPPIILCQSCGQAL